MAQGGCACSPRCAAQSPGAVLPHVTYFVRSSGPVLWAGVASGHIPGLLSSGLRTSKSELLMTSLESCAIWVCMKVRGRGLESGSHSITPKRAVGVGGQSVCVLSGLKTQPVVQLGTRPQ